MEIHDIRHLLPVHPTRRYRNRRESSLVGIAVHHSATEVGNHPIRQIKSFARYHVSKGWPGIGYHYVIGVDGKVYKTGRILEKRYHVGNANSKYVGVCLIGNFNDTYPTKGQLQSLKELFTSIQGMPGYAGVRKLVGHRDVGNTECPGANFTPAMIASP